MTTPPALGVCQVTPLRTLHIGPEPRRRAQFSADEPIARLRMICQSWKVMFHAEYSSGQPLRMLVDLRAVINAALARTPTSASARTKTAAAGVNSSASNSEAPEFVVSSDSPGRKDDGSA